MRSALGLLASTVVLGLGLQTPARAQTTCPTPLLSFGPTTAATGFFPAYYIDSNLLPLRLCLDTATGLCLSPAVNPEVIFALPISFPTNFPRVSSYFVAHATIAVGTNPNAIELTITHKALFNSVVAAAGQQLVQTQVRIKSHDDPLVPGSTGLLPNSTYTFSYPYGLLVCTTDASGNVPSSCDRATGVFVPFPPGNFGSVLAGDIGPYLVPIDGPAAPAGFLGDGVSLHHVTGSPCGLNFFKVSGPGLAVPLLQNQFTVLGQLAQPCLNGLLDPGEQCDRGTSEGDCCSSTCQFDAPNTPCDDGNPCTDHTNGCDGAGVCPVTVVNTAACNDGNPCTTLDACSGGVCVGGPPPNCNDNSVCTNDSCNPGLGCVHTNNNGASCSDGNLCTTDTCNPASGCVHTSNNVPCSDGNACTTSDTCSGGICLSGPNRNCNDGNVCTDDSCNPLSGCVHTNNTASCSDANPCTTNDTCHSGVCVGGAALDCNDGNVCTTDSCNPVTGCTHTNNSSPCTDGNACTTNDACSGGACVGGTAPNCDDNNGCTTDACDPGTGCTHTNNSSPCTDGNACTQNDTCSGGTCVGGPGLECNDGNICTTDFCNPSVGCVYVNNAAPCDDHSECTSNDTCQNGICTGGPAANCNDLNPCTADTCLPVGGCRHTNLSGSCDDGNPCTTGDTCSGGSCFGGPPTNCDDNNGCTDDSCAPATGCVHVKNTASCNDGNACTTNDTCSAGVCAGGPPRNCADANVCTNDTCNPATGCVATNNTAVCDDGDPATILDRCAAGVCVAGNLGCTAVPITGCKLTLAPAKTQLQLKRGRRSSSDRLSWKWRAGVATIKAEFADPVGGPGGFALCLYDAVGGVPQLRLDRGVTPGGTCGANPCWQETFTGFRYKDSFSSLSEGIQAVTLRAGDDGLAQVVVKGRGSALGVPLLPLQQDTTATIQLIGRGGCWQSDFEPPAINTGTSFSDTASN